MFSFGGKVKLEAPCDSHFWYQLWCNGRFYSWWVFINRKYSTLKLSSINNSLSGIQQRLSKQPLYSSFTIPRVSQETARGLSQGGFSTRPQDCTLQQSISLTANSGPQDRTARRSVFIASPDPSALEVQQSHYLTCFTAACSNTTFSGTLQPRTRRTALYFFTCPQAWLKKFTMNSTLPLKW
jgi:hypothetical protein